MNPNPQAIRILCFGDSNTWGRSGASINRYPEDMRWTGLLQQELGLGYEIIEEGLRSRTTDLDEDDPRFPNRNGVQYLRPCLESQSPLDLVILWLGTNDLKAKFNRTSDQVAATLRRMVQLIKTTAVSRDGTPSQILLIAPPLVREEVLKPGSQFVGAGEKSVKLVQDLKNVAKQEQISFLDPSSLVTTGVFDGVHLDPDQHQRLASLLFEKITKLL